MAEQSRRQGDKNHIAMWFKTWWFAIVFGLGLVGSVITLYTDVQFIRKAVKPESLAEYGVEQAKIEQKREVRWCLTKLSWATDISRERVMGCAD